MTTLNEKLELAAGLFGSSEQSAVRRSSAVAVSDSSDGLIQIQYPDDDEIIEVPCVTGAVAGDEVEVLVEGGHATVIGPAGWGDGLEEDIDTVSSEMSDESERLRAEVFGGLTASLETNFSDETVSTFFFSNKAISIFGATGSHKFVWDGDEWGLFVWDGDGWEPEGEDVSLESYGVSIVDYEPVSGDYFLIGIGEVNGLKNDTETAIEQVHETLEPLASHVLLIDGVGLKVTAGEDSFYTLLSADRLSFYAPDESDPVAYISSRNPEDDSELFIRDVTIKDQLRIGGYEANQREDGSVFLKWVGLDG